MSNSWEYLKKRFYEEEVPYPRVMNLELTTRCNLKCIMCPKTLGSQDTFEDGDMDERVFQVVVDQVLPHVRQVVLSFVGEPLLRRDYIFQLMDHCYQRRVAVSLVTNGLFLDRETCDFLVSRKLLELNVSIDSANENIYKQIRGGNFKKLIGNLRHLQELKTQYEAAEPYVKLSFVAMKRNITCLGDFVDLAASVGAREVVVQSLHVQNGLENEVIELSDKNGYFRYLARAREIGQTKGIAVSISPDLAIPDPGFPVYKADSEDFVCRLPWTTIYIDRFGGVRPCCGLPPLGNLLEAGLEGVWFGENFQNFRRKLILEDSGYCKDCSEHSSCNNPRITGVLNLKSPHQLGNGWYHLEVEDEQDYRWTGKKASFYLNPDGGKSLLLEYNALEKSGSRAYSELRLENKVIGNLDHAKTIAEIPVDVNHQEVFKFDIETMSSVIPWAINSDYPDPRLLGLRIGFAGMVNPHDYEDTIRLVYLNIPRESLSSGGEYSFQVYWKQLAATEHDLYLFLHFTHESLGFLQKLIAPLSRYHPWFRQRFFQHDQKMITARTEYYNLQKTRMQVKVPSTLQSGNYRINMGCWMPENSRKRLKTQGEFPGSYLHIGTVSVVSCKPCRVYP